MKAVKENKVYTIGTEQEAENYYLRGFDILNDEAAGNVPPLLLRWKETSDSLLLLAKESIYGYNEIVQQMKIQRCELADELHQSRRRVPYGLPDIHTEKRMT